MNKVLKVIVAVSLSFLVLPSSVAADSKNPYGAPVVDPAGPNESILTVSKGAKTVDFTFSELKKMKSSKVTIFEPLPLFR